MYEDFILVHEGKPKSELCHDQSVWIRFSNTTFCLFMVCSVIPIIALSKGLICQWYPAKYPAKSVKYHCNIVVSPCLSELHWPSADLLRCSCRRCLCLFRHVIILETSRIIFAKFRLRMSPIFCNMLRLQWSIRRI